MRALPLPPAEARSPGRLHGREPQRLPRRWVNRRLVETITVAVSGGMSSAVHARAPRQGLRALLVATDISVAGDGRGGTLRVGPSAPVYPPKTPARS